MAITVKELKEYLNKLNDTDTIFIGYSDSNECYCEIITGEDIINEANEMHEEFIGDEVEEKFTDVNDALCYLADMCHDYHYMELDK